MAFRSCLALGLTTLLLAACGSGPAAPAAPQGTSTPREPASPGPCAFTPAASTAEFAGFGASAAAWEGAHGADPTLSARCSQSGHVVEITVRLKPAAPADSSVMAAPGIPLLRADTALQAAERLLPADQTMTDDVTRTGCRVVRFSSATVGTELPHDDPAGVVDVVLASAAGADFHQQQIAQARLQVGHGISAPGC